MKMPSKIILLALMLFITAFFPGCSGNKLSTQDRKPVIKVIVKKKDASFFTVVRMGAGAAAREFDASVDFDGPKDESDISGQIKIVEDAIDRKADAIVLAACDYNRLVGAAEKSVSAGIPVITIDSELNYSKVNTFIGTDNIEAGKILGQTLVAKVGGNCEILIMSFIKGAASSDRREEGLLEELKRHPDVRVLGKEYCNSDSNTAKQLTESFLSGNPQTDAIVCLNAQSTEGTAQAVEELNLKDKVKIIGFDSTPLEVSYMEDDIIQALVVQKPFSMGYLGVKSALDVLKGKSVPSRVNTETKVIDKGNMYQPENQKLVFPFTN